MLTPLELIEQAIKWETNHDAIYKIVNEMVYTKAYFERLKNDYFALSELDFFIEIPEEKRIKTFSFDYDAIAIGKVKERVKECREFINNLIK